MHQTKTNPENATLGGEIQMLRTMMQRVMRSVSGGDLALKDELRALDILSVAAQRLASLLKADQALGQAREENWTARINQAMAELLEEMQRQSSN